MTYKSVAAAGLFAMGLSMTACGEKSAKEQSAMNEKNATSAGRVTLPSGLSYEVLTAPKTDAQGPKKEDRVSVHYTGWLDQKGTLGTKFDSSVDRGFPFKFVVGIGQVIAGWDEGVMLMKIGEKRRYFIPSKLGYGAYGAGAAIPPNADLIFDVEMLAIG